MYLRGSKWNMRQRRPKINWFLVVVLLILIAIVTYIDRYILPNAQTPFRPTPTETRSPESIIKEADDFFKQGKLNSSIDTYNEAIRLQPQESTTYIALARVQVFAGLYDDALLNAQNSLLLNNKNALAYAVQGWAQTYKADYTGADDSLKTALKMDPSNGQAHAYAAFLYGRMYEDNAGPYVDPIQTAIDESNTAISLAPDNLEAHWARAYILSITSQDNLPQAIEQYNAAIAINPNIAEIHLELGTVYKANNNIEEAVQEYTLANTYNPSDYRPELYSSRAEAFIGVYDKALQWADAAVRDAPADADLRGNWGYMLFKNYDYLNADIQLGLAINGGETDDGITIEPLSPAKNDIWVSKYYYAYAISLANENRCSEMLLMTQKIRDFFRADPYADLNATIAEDICAEKLGTPTTTPPVPTATP